MVGAVLAPFPTSDFSSFLLQAQSSGAKVIGLCNAGSDTVNSIKQAGEFGLTQAGIKLAGLLVFISDVHALGLQTAQGLNLTESFYWDLNDRTRAFTDRVIKTTDGFARAWARPACYGGAVHYLKAVAAMGVGGRQEERRGHGRQMKAMPTDDDAFGAGSIREDGRALHPAYLFEVKSPAESKAPWDYYKLVATTPADQAFRPLHDGGCPLVNEAHAMTLAAAPCSQASAAGAAAPARAQGATIKLGVLNDMSGPYRDTGGPHSVACVRQAVQGVRRPRLRRRGRQRRPPEQAGSGRLDRPALVRPGRRGRDRGRADLVRGAGGELGGAGEEQGLPQLRRRHGGPDGRAVLAQHGALDLRRLHAGQEHRRRHGEGGRR